MYMYGPDTDSHNWHLEIKETGAYSTVHVAQAVSGTCTRIDTYMIVLVHVIHTIYYRYQYVQCIYVYMYTCPMTSTKYLSALSS